MDFAAAPALTKFRFALENIPWEISRRMGHMMHQRTLGSTRTANFSLRMRCCRSRSARFLCWIARRIRAFEPCVSLSWRSRWERATLLELPRKTFEQDLHRKNFMASQCRERTHNWPSAFTNVANANQWNHLMVLGELPKQFTSKSRKHKENTI